MRPRVRLALRRARRSSELRESPEPGGERRRSRGAAGGAERSLRGPAAPQAASSPRPRRPDPVRAAWRLRPGRGRGGRGGAAGACGCWPSPCSTASRTVSAAGPAGLPPVVVPPRGGERAAGWTRSAGCVCDRRERGESAPPPFI